MGEYAAIEKEAKLFTELCVHNDAIDPNLFDEFGVKRGLRDKDGNGVLAGITNISRIDAFEMRDGVKTPCDGKLWYRGYNVYDLIRGLRGKRYGFEEVAYLLLLGDLPNEQQLNEFTDCLTKCRALPSNFVRDVIMKAPSKDLMNTFSAGIAGTASGIGSCLTVNVADPKNPYNRPISQWNNSITYAVLILSPEHAATMFRDTKSKEAIKEYLVKNTVLPYKLYTKAICEPGEAFGPYDENTLIPRFTQLESIKLVVAGGPGKQSQIWVPFVNVWRPVSAKIAE